MYHSNLSCTIQYTHAHAKQQHTDVHIHACTHIYNTYVQYEAWMQISKWRHRRYTTRLTYWLSQTTLIQPAIENFRSKFLVMWREKIDFFLRSNVILMKDRKQHNSFLTTKNNKLCNFFFAIHIYYTLKLGYRRIFTSENLKKASKCELKEKKNLMRFAWYDQFIHTYTYIYKCIHIYSYRCSKSSKREKNKFFFLSVCLFLFGFRGVPLFFLSRHTIGGAA